jgi:hypothetical protein
MGLDRFGGSLRDGATDHASNKERQIVLESISRLNIEVVR